MCVIVVLCHHCWPAGSIHRRATCQLPSIVETPQPPQTKSNSYSHQYRWVACTHKLKVGWYLSMQRWFYYSYKLLRHILALSSKFKPASSKASADDIARVMFSILHSPATLIHSFWSCVTWDLKVLFCQPPKLHTRTQNFCLYPHPTFSQSRHISH